LVKPGGQAQPPPGVQDPRDEHVFGEPQSAPTKQERGEHVQAPAPQESQTPWPLQGSSGSWLAHWRPAETAMTPPAAALGFVMSSTPGAAPLLAASAMITALSSATAPAPAARSGTAHSSAPEVAFSASSDGTYQSEGAPLKG
jgi:hypothetical protein